MKTRRNITRNLGLSAAAVVALAGTAAAQPFCSSRHSTLTAVDQSDAHAGWSVASAGSYLFYGAPDFDQAAGNNSGKIISRVLSGGGWSFGQSIIPPGVAADTRAGRSLSADGDWLFIGGGGGAIEDGKPRGRAWIYKRTGSNYAHINTLGPASLQAGDDFGFSLAVDGAYAVIGAPGDDELGEDAGAVHVYQFNGSVWSYYDKIALFSGAENGLGYSVAAEGSTFAVGCPGYDGVNKTNNGAVFVFRKFGQSWTLTDSLYGQATGDLHGFAVAMDGDYLAVGNLDDDNSGLTDAGSVTIYRFDGSDYVFDSLVLCPEAMTDGQFGVSVDLKGDRLAVGAAGNNKMYAFKRSGSTWRVQAGAPGTDDDAAFPWDVAATSAGIVGGDPFDDTQNINAFTDSGSARHINVDDTHGADSWHLTPLDAVPFWEYGCSEFATPSPEADIPGACGTSIDSPDVWYWFYAQPGRLILSTQESQHDTVLTLFGDDLGTQALACNDDISGLDRDSRIVYDVQQAGYLNLRISGYNGASGLFKVSVRYECAADLSGSSDPNDVAYGQPDGLIDATDFFYYLDQFSAGNLAIADLSGSSDPNDPAYGVADGATDASDFFYYLDLFVNGCP